MPIDLDIAHIANYKKQRNLVVSVNRQAKSKYFNEDSNTESSRPFSETCKPYFSNKHARGDSKIMLTENDKMLLKNEDVAKEFNQYFGHITDSPDLYEFPDVRVCEGRDDIDNIVYKFRNQSSITKIKERYKVKENFSFRLATTEEIKTIIRDLATNKAAGGEIPVNVFKKSNFSFDELTICVNYALINRKFPITLKNANVTPVHKKDDPADKTNFRPIFFCVCVLLLLSKVFERVIYNQLGKYMDTYLNKLLCDLEKPTLLNMPSLSYYNDGRMTLITLG